MGVAVGTAPGPGYVGWDGQLTPMFLRASNVVLTGDKHKETANDNTHIPGSAQKYLAQKAAFRLAKVKGIELLEKNNDKKLEELQLKAREGNPDRGKVKEIFFDMGKHFAMFLNDIFNDFGDKFPRILLLTGRITKQAVSVKDGNGNKISIPIESGKAFHNGIIEGIKSLPNLGDLEIKYPDDVVKDEKLREFSQAYGAIYLVNQKIQRKNNKAGTPDVSSPIKAILKLNINNNVKSGVIKEIIEKRFQELSCGDRDIFAYKFIDTSSQKVTLGSGAEIEVVLFNLREEYVNQQNDDNSLCPFCNILDKQVLAEIEIEGREYKLIANKFPYAPFHLNLVSKEHREQSLDAKRVEDALLVLKAMGEDYEATFNSPGAGHSVYHLHFQIFKKQTNIWKYIDAYGPAKEGLIVGWPAPAFMFKEKDIENLSEATLIDINNLSLKNMPYNLSFNLRKNNPRAILFPRQDEYAEINLNGSHKLKFASLEMTGHILIANEELYRKLAEVGLTQRDIENVYASSALGALMRTPSTNIHAGRVPGELNNEELPEGMEWFGGDLEGTIFESTIYRPLASEELRKAVNRIIICASSEGLGDNTISEPLLIASVQKSFPGVQTYVFSFHPYFYRHGYNSLKIIELDYSYRVVSDLSRVVKQIKESLALIKKDEEDGIEYKTLVFRKTGFIESNEFREELLGSFVSVEIGGTFIDPAMTFYAEGNNDKGVTIETSLNSNAIYEITAIGLFDMGLELISDRSYLSVSEDKAVGLWKRLENKGYSGNRKLATIVTEGKSQGRWLNGELRKTVQGLVDRGYVVAFDLGHKDAVRTELAGLVGEYRADFKENILDIPVLGIEDMMMLLRLSYLVVSVETGLMHLAVALDKSTIGLIPKGSRVIDWKPINADNFVAIERDSFNEMKAEEILRAVDKFKSSSPLDALVRIYSANIRTGKHTFTWGRPAKESNILKLLG
ncbi:MAG: DUF4922 domain-containing protein, partial [Candidatus Omnitrophota bacterium]